MKQLAPLQPFLLLTLVTMCGFTIACGTPTQGAPVLQSVSNTANPLVAQYTGATDCQGQIMVEFGPDTSYGRTTPWYPTSGLYRKTSILVAGMRASTTYHMRSQYQCIGGATGTGPDLTFTTGPLPSLAFPTLRVTRPNPSDISPENPGIELVDITVPDTPAFFTDRDGNPIWYYDVGKGNYPYTFKLLPNGHMIVSITLPGFDSTLREVDLTGKVIREMDVSTLGSKMLAAGYDFAPTAYHHDLLPLANGHVIVLTFFAQNFTDLPGYPGTLGVVGDALVDLDQNWNPVWAWNSFDHLDALDINRHLNGLPDWTHSNTVVYSPADGNLLLSMRHQSWVLKIDYNNGTGAGDVLWKLGYQGSFALTQNGIPSDDPSLWFSFQHFPALISQSGSQTNLTIWDNGDFRVLDTNGTKCGEPPSFPGCESRASVLHLDESAMVADLSWMDQTGYYGVWGGSINQLDNGNIEFDINSASPLINPDVASEVQEVTQGPNPQIVWKLDVTPVSSFAYRAYRVPSLYPGVEWNY